MLVNGSFETTSTAITSNTASYPFGDFTAFAGLTDWTHVSNSGARLANRDTLANPGPPYFMGNGGAGTISLSYDTNNLVNTA